MHPKNILTDVNDSFLLAAQVVPPSSVNFLSYVLPLVLPEKPMAACNPVIITYCWQRYIRERPRSQEGIQSPSRHLL